MKGVGGKSSLSSSSLLVIEEEEEEEEALAVLGTCKGLGATMSHSVTEGLLVYLTRDKEM